MGCTFQAEGANKQRLPGTPSRAAFENHPFSSSCHICSELTISEQIKAAGIAGFILDSCPGTLNTLGHCKVQTHLVQR